MGNILETNKYLPLFFQKNIRVLTGEIDIYNGIHIKSKEHPFTSKVIAKTSLEKSIEDWKESKRHGVWFEVYIKVIKRIFIVENDM